MKHVGKMANNNAKIVVVFRTLPNDPHHALVVGTQQLPDAFHDSLMSLVESASGQQADELADILDVRRFPDGSPMLSRLHVNGYMKKVRTSEVLMTPDTKSSIKLDELNELIAQQRGVKLADLAVKGDGSEEVVDTVVEASKEYTAPPEPPAPAPELSIEELKARAKAMMDEAEKLLKMAEVKSKPQKTRQPKE